MKSKIIKSLKGKTLGMIGVGEKSEPYLRKTEEVNRGKSIVHFGFGKLHGWYSKTEPTKPDILDDEI